MSYRKNKIEKVKLKHIENYFYYFQDKVIGESLKRKCIYENGTIQYILNILKKETGGIFLDIGAHVGIHTCIVAYNYPKFLIYSFEPNPDIYILLKYNTRKYKNVKCFNAGIYNNDISIDLFYSLLNTGTSSIINLNGKLAYIKQNCVMKKIDYFNINFDKVKIIKIDTQGCEGIILDELYPKLLKNTCLIVERDGIEEKFVPITVASIVKKYNMEKIKILDGKNLVYLK